MPTVPEGAKKPTDRKKKDEGVEFDPVFSFDHDGTEYTFDARTDSVLTPGFIRRNRNNQNEFTFGLMESLASDETLDVIDNMSHAEFQALGVRFGEHVEVVIGGSPGN